MSLAVAKAAARARAFARRETAHRLHSKTASDALLVHLAGTEGRVIAGYLPIRTEADPRPAMAALAGRNRIAVPVVTGRETPLLFREWHPDTPLARGSFGVMVPVSGEDLTPDIVIAPLVAFDGRLQRLGYGGGYYDRTLEFLRARGPVHALGFAYSAQRDEALPLEPTDQPLDALVTELGEFRRA